MKTEIRVPKMGMDTTEVTVSKWLVKVGDSVKVGSELVELESEKVAFVLEAEVAGEIVSITQPAGSIVPVGDLLGAVETKKD
jgi:pyruvate/2-oxoglutarate dehydrogenase complex dihydrolipoamide acyltransferase (E2) component